MHGLPLGVTVQRHPCTFMQVDWKYRVPSARSGLPSFAAWKNDDVLQRKILKPNPIQKTSFYCFLFPVTEMLNGAVPWQAGVC